MDISAKYWNRGTWFAAAWLQLTWSLHPPAFGTRDGPLISTEDSDLQESLAEAKLQSQQSIQALGEHRLSDRALEGGAWEGALSMAIPKPWVPGVWKFSCSHQRVGLALCVARECVALPFSPACAAQDNNLCPCWRCGLQIKIQVSF